MWDLFKETQQKTVLREEKFFLPDISDCRGLAKLKETIEYNKRKLLLLKNRDCFSNREEYLKSLEKIRQNIFSVNYVESIDEIFKIFFEVITGKRSFIPSLVGVFDSWRYFEYLSLLDDYRSEFYDYSEIFTPGRVFQKISFPKTQKSFFKKADLSDVLIYNLVLKKKHTVNLWDNSLKVNFFDEDFFWKTNGFKAKERANGKVLDFGTCQNMEKRFLNFFVLSNGRNFSFHKGVVVFLEGRVVGVFKTVEGEEKTMLALRTVVDKNDKVIFYKGMVYGWSDLKGYLKNGSQTDKQKGKNRFVKKGLFAEVESLSGLTTTLSAVHLEDLGKKFIANNSPLIVNNLRFVVDPYLLKKSDKFVKEVEKGRMEFNWLNSEGLCNRVLRED